MASLVLLGDLGKGVVALLLVSRFVSTDLWPQLACAAASILGHSFSCFLHFKGGRGVATGLGVLLYFMPDVSVFALTVWLAIVFVTRYVSLGSIVAAFCAPLGAYYLGLRSSSCYFYGNHRCCCHCPPIMKIWSDSFTARKTKFGKVICP